MYRLINITAFDGVMLMNIFNFLPHHLFSLYEFWVAAFLPKLIGSIIFMRFFVKSQLLQNLSNIVL